MHTPICFCPKSLFRVGTLLSLAFAVCLTLPAVSAKSDPNTERAKIRAMRDSALAELYKLHPGSKARIKNAAGYAVFSNIGINLFFASVAGGSGIVVRDGIFGDTETFMKMGSAGVGLGLGVKNFRAIFIFSDKERLSDFIDKGWDFSGQADAAAKSDDKGSLWPAPTPWCRVSRFIKSPRTGSPCRLRCREPNIGRTRI